MRIVIEFDENEVQKFLELLAHKTRDDEIKEKVPDITDSLKPKLPKIADKLERLENIARLEGNEAVGKAPRWDEAIR